MAGGGFDIDIKFEDNSPEFRKALEQASERILFEWGQLGVEGAVDEITHGSNQAVDTGRLRASISFVTAEGDKGTGASPVANSKGSDTLDGKAEKNSVYIGSNVEYAEYVHDGTHKMNARPFLRASIDDKRDDMKVHTQEILEGKR